MSYPNHVGIIMDGNGRWATSRGLTRKEGHKKGIKVCTQIIHAAIDYGINILSLYAFSTENWKRPEDEVLTIMDILDLYLQTEIFIFIRRKVRFRVIGDQSRLSKKTQFLINKIVKLSSRNKGMELVFALNYGGHDEVMRAVKRMATNQYDFNNINIEDFEQHLDTSDLRPVDLVIRTSGEQRLSNFLIWQSAYAELFFTKTLWPDFTREEFHEALEDFKNRNRRYGDISGNVPIQTDYQEK